MKMMRCQQISNLSHQVLSHPLTSHHSRDISHGYCYRILFVRHWLTYCLSPSDHMHSINSRCCTSHTTKNDNPESFFVKIGLSFECSPSYVDRRGREGISLTKSFWCLIKADIFLIGTTNLLIVPDIHRICIAGHYGIGLRFRKRFAEKTSVTKEIKCCGKQAS